MDYENRAHMRRLLLCGAAGIAVAILAMTSLGQRQALPRTLPAGSTANPTSMESELVHTLEALREELRELKAERAINRQNPEILPLATGIQANAASARAPVASSKRMRKAGPPVASASQASELQRTAKQMKELADYMKEVERGVGLLDAATSNQQLLQKKSAELQQGIAKP